MRTYVSEWDYDFFSGFQILNIFWLETWAGFFFGATPLDDVFVLVYSYRTVTWPHGDLAAGRHTRTVTFK